MRGGSKGWLAAIVQSSDDAIIGRTLDGIVQSWNAGAKRLFGYEPEEIVGQSILTLIPPALHEEEPRIVAELMNGNRIDHYQTVRVGKDGSLVEVSLSVSPILDGSGAVVGAAKIARDISAANRLLRQAERASAAKSQFLATMSHELRTPLNAIAGYVDLLNMEIRGPITDGQRDALNRIRRSQKSLLRLIEEVLDFAKLESGRTEYRLEDVRLDEVLGVLESFVAPQLAQKGLVYEVTLCGESVLVAIDRARVEQILLNLLSNALKFTDTGRIELRCVVDDATVRVRVKDTGRGIRPAVLDTIFEPFVQEDQPLTRQPTGTGLGLAISRRLAREMGGDITVESIVGEGSTFTLVLPRIAAQPE